MQKKIHISNTTKVIVVSDLHLSHGLIFESRGFSTVEEHDAFIFESLERQAVKESTVLINLGDNCLAQNQESNFNRLSLIPFEEHYCFAGNHPSGYKQCYRKALESNGFSRDIEVYPLKYNNVTFVGEIANFVIGGNIYVCSHFPLFIWDNMKDGARMLSGHSHSNNPHNNFEASLLGKSFDCGVENAITYTNGARPFFYLEEIEAITANKETILHDHH